MYSSKKCRSSIPGKKKADEMGTYAKKWNKSKYKIKNPELKLIIFG